MKRGGPPVRRTPLARSAINRLSGFGQQRRIERRAEWHVLRFSVFSRDNGRCVLCDERVDVDTFECHHRRLRSRGGPDSHSNLVTLCRRCHHDRVHRFPEWAKGMGLMVPTWVDHKRWPVLLGVYGGGWTLEEGNRNPQLWQVPDDDTGAWTVTAPHGDQHAAPAPWLAAA